jgi:hypothetical protein
MPVPMCYNDRWMPAPIDVRKKLSGEDISMSLAGTWIFQVFVSFVMRPVYRIMRVQPMEFDKWTKCLTCDGWA